MSLFGRPPARISASRQTSPIAAATAAPRQAQRSTATMPRPASTAAKLVIEKERVVAASSSAPVASAAASTRRSSFQEM